MKAFFLQCIALFILTLSANLWAIDVGKYTSGGWGDPNQSGHGYSIEVMDDNIAIIFWYTHNPDGTSTFLVTVGFINGNTISGNTSYYSGMKFGEFDPATLDEEPWGTVTVTFHDCNTATLNYSSTMSHKGVPFGSGTVQLQRLVTLKGMQCSDNPYAGLYQGNFYSNVLGEIIPGVAVLAPNGEFAAVSYDGIAGFGSWSANGDSFTGSGIAISMDPNAYFKSDLTLSGAISPEHRVNASYSVSGGDNGVADLFATPSLYRRGVKFNDIAGTYTGTNLVSGLQGVGIIGSDGSISGSDNTTGCTYDGQLEIPDEKFNLIRLIVNVTSCSPANGQYIGYAMVDDYQFLGDGRKIILLGTDGTYATIIELVR